MAYIALNKIPTEKVHAQKLPRAVGSASFITMELIPLLPYKPRLRLLLEKFNYAELQ